MKGLYIGKDLWRKTAIDFLHSAIVKCGTSDQYGEEMDEKVREEMDDKVSNLRRNILNEF